MNKIYKLVRSFILLSIITVVIPINIAYADVTVEEIMNNLTGVKQLYNTTVSPAYLRNNLSEEFVNPQTGDLTITQTDFSLPGRSGLDLNITRLYKSGMTSWHECKTRYSSGVWIDYIESTEKSSSFYEDRYNLGAGMRFSFPEIELRVNADGTSYKYLHTETGDVYRIIDPCSSNDYQYTLEGHTVNDLTLKVDTTFFNDQPVGGPSGYSKYVMIEKDGKKTYFALDGRILGIVDRYNNTIKFQYTVYTYNINGYIKTKILNTKIIDTVGREVKIDYVQDATYTKDSTGYISGTSEVRIYLPDSTPTDLTDNKKIVYHKSLMLYTEPVSGTVYPIRMRLQWTYDVDGLQKYYYRYEQPSYSFTFYNGSSYTITNTYENIDIIRYSKTNKLRRYNYGTFTKRLGSTGSIQYRKVIKNIDLSVTGWDDSQLLYEDKYVGIIKNQMDYVYTNEPDGYGYTGYTEEESYLKDTYRYYSEKTDMRGAKTKYTYNGLHQTLTTDDYGADHKQVTATFYDANNLPLRTETSIYKVANWLTIGTPIKKIENFSYDVYGNLLSYTDPQAARDVYGNPIDSEHTTTYTYATDKYHILTSKTWKKDAAITSRIEYDVDSLGNVTQERKIHTGNNVVTDYLYDSYGNMTKTTLHYADNTGNTYITNYEYGTDADGTNHLGAYLTREYSTLDGVTIAKKNAYDFYTGNLKAEIDENGNRTSYQYDILNRLTVVTYPDSTTKQYQYIDHYYSDKEIWYKSQNNLYTSYKYDIFGNNIGTYIWEYYNDVLQWVLHNSNEYDSNGNKTKEIDIYGHSTRYAYDSANRLTRKSFWENDTTEKKYMTLVYTDVYDANTPLLLTITDEEGYAKKYRWNIANKLTQMDATPDKATDYSTLYTYDYVGNQTSVKDARGNYTYYTYDDLDRLIKSIDALNYETQYYYDAADKLTEQKNPKGISTYNEYDLLGQIIRVKAPAADGSIATTRYIYDNAGNKIKEIAPNDYDPAKDTAALAATMSGMSYTYNNMNRLVSTLSPEGAVLEYRKYDNNGNITKVVDGLRYNGSVDTSPGTLYYYDYMNRVTDIYDALGSHQVYNEYDLMGRLTLQTNGRGYSTQYTYNTDGTLSKVTYPDTGCVEYTYNKLGQKITEKNQLGNVTTYAYNGLGQLESIQDAYAQTIQNQYDPNGNLISTKDKRGNYTYFTYDANNHLTQKQIPLEISSGSILYALENYTYDQLGNVIKKVSTGTKDTAATRETNYTYYDNNLVSTTSDSSGSYVINDYDKNGNLIKNQTLKDTGIYDISRYVYDNRNRMTASIKLVDESDIYDAAALPNIAALRDTEYTGKLQLITGYEYDILGNKTKTIDPRAYGYLAEDTANRGKYTISYSYDILNRLEKTKWIYNGSEVYKQYYYDEVGNIIKERNEKGSNTIYSYDLCNRPLTITDALNNITINTYDLAGNKIRQKNAKGDTITYTYDALNRLSTTKDPYNNIISKKLYDENGNVIKEIDAKGYLSSTEDATRYGTLYTYDLANRLTKVVDPEIAALNDPSKSTVTYEYNQYSQKSKATDALGNVTQYEYDSAGRLTKVIDPLNVSTQYSYDKEGSKLTMTDGRGKIMRYTYGAFGMLEKTTDADLRYTKYKYDLGQNAVSITDRNSNETLCTYDNRSLLLTKSVTQTGDSISCNYDAVGNRTSMTDATGSSTYTYDALNRLLNITKGGILQITYTYDTIGNIATVKDKKANTTTYTYDKCNRMSTVSCTVAGVANTTTYTYDANGNRQSIAYQGGVKEEYTYNKNNKLLTLTNKKPDGSTISSYSYTYDLTGRQKTKTDGYGQSTYTYDGAGRITQATTPGKTSIYAYDGAGNRIALTETYTSEQSSGYIDEATGNEIRYITKEEQYTYTSANKLIKLSEKMKDSSGAELLEKITAYNYDYNGNQTYQTASYKKLYDPTMQESFGTTAIQDSTSTYENNLEITHNEYDGFNRLKKADIIKAGARTITTYTYDGDDLRTSKTTKSSANNYQPIITNYQYDRQHVILETDATDAIKARYVRGINYIARIDAVNKISYYLYNGHGDIVQTASGLGAVENQYDYDIFGNPTLTIEQYANAIRYAGEFYDTETGLYYLRARYYDPYTGRFISEDSYWGEDSNPLSLNLYTYCHNDPINFIDPTGHWEEGDSYRSDEAQAQILEATLDYIAAAAAGDTLGMANAHQAAEDARNGIIYGHGKVSAGDIAKQLDEVRNSKYVSGKAKEDLNKSNVAYVTEKNNSKMEEEQQQQIIDMINATRSGPQGTENLGSLEDDYNLSEWKSSDRLKIDISGNTVHIYWCVVIKGKDADDIFPGTNQTYKDKIEKAIEEKWSGQYNINGRDVKVITTVEVLNDGKDHIIAGDQKSSTINFYNEADISHMNPHGKFLIFENGSWEKSNPGTIDMYAGDSRNSEDHRYDSDTFNVTIAHEFGHILGIKDGYNDSKTESINSIMCDEYGYFNKISKDDRKATDLDIKKLLDAYQENSWQRWP